jgi:DNA-binding NtrC family response regulator
VERAVVMAPGDELTCEILPTGVTTGRSPRAIGAPIDFEGLAEELVHRGLGDAGAEAGDIHSRIVDRVEREVIAQVLQECAGVQIKAASRLGINRNTLHKKLKQYGLDGSGGEE